jgi:cytochrome P450
VASTPLTDPLPEVPPHVPPELVEWFDFRNDESFHADPHARLESLRARGRVFFTPFARGINGLGTWVFTRGEDIRKILQDPETFASGGVRPFAEAIGEKWVITPLEVDPPDHAPIRQVLNPIFSPAEINKLSNAVFARAEELVEPLKRQSGCEFMEAFAKPFPVSIFLELLGLPLKNMPRYIGIANDIQHGTVRVQTDAIRQLRDLLSGIIEERRGMPGSDLISRVLAIRIDGQPLNDNELIGISFNFFLGGLDTVRSTLGYVFRYLAAHLEQQQSLREQPALIPDAVEELLRVHNVVTTGRRATRDVDIAGVHIKKGDNLALAMSFASRDPEEFDRPNEVEFTRSPNRHSTFGFGIHRCLGSHLARREIVSAIQAWMKLMPPFRLANDVPPRSAGPAIVGLSELQLAWN